MLRARSLRTRLVALTLVLLAAAAIVIGLVTALAVRHSLISRLDSELAAVSNGPGRPRPSDAVGDGPPAGGGGPPDLITVNVTDGQVTDARVRTRGGSDRAFPQSDLATMLGVPPGTRPMTLDLPALGQYRVVATTRLDGSVQITGLPEGQLQQTVTERRESQPGRLPQLREHARVGEAGHRVELVDQHAVALDEEVHPRQP